MGQGAPDRRWRSWPPSGSACPSSGCACTTPDTDVTPYDQQTSSSRSTYSMGSAVIGRPAATSREQLLALACGALEIAAGDLELDGRPRPARRARPSGRRLRDARPARPARQPARPRRVPSRGRAGPRDRPGHRLRPLAPGGGAAEVEVDLETGRVRAPPLPRRRLRRPGRQPGPGRAPDRGQRRLRPRPGAVRGADLRRRPAPEREPRATT